MKDLELKKGGYDDFRFVQYDNLKEFYDYINTMKTNKHWFGKNEQSEDGTLSFTGTQNLQEAKDLFINGIPDTATKLTQMLKSEKKLQPVNAMKRVNAPAGFQANVPLYMMGVPNNMISQQMKPMKKKVLNLYADISYSAYWGKEQIETECIKKFRIISKLESQNYRVNLYMFVATCEYTRGKRQGIILCIKLKSANERMNISKLAFTLTHPSMLRRLYFRWLEVYPNLLFYFSCYGKPISGDSVIDVLGDGYILPIQIKKDLDKINNLDDLKYL